MGETRARPLIVISEWNATPKRLLGQKTYFWGNIDFLRVVGGFAFLMPIKMETLIPTVKINLTEAKFSDAGLYREVGFAAWPVPLLFPSGSVIPSSSRQLSTPDNLLDSKSALTTLSAFAIQVWNDYMAQRLNLGENLKTVLYSVSFSPLRFKSCKSNPLTRYLYKASSMVVHVQSPPFKTGV